MAHGFDVAYKVRACEMTDEVEVLALLAWLDVTAKNAGTLVQQQIESMSESAAALIRSQAEEIARLRGELDAWKDCYEVECEVRKSAEAKLAPASPQEPVSEIEMHGMTLNQYADELFERAPQMVNSADGALAVQASQIIRWLATKLYAAPI
jgi:hypothetical protein